MLLFADEHIPADTNIRQQTTSHYV